MLACLVTELYPTLWTVAHQVPLSIFQGFFQARVLEWVAIFFLQRIFPTQGSHSHSLCLLHCRQIFLSTEPPGKPHGQYSYSLLRSWFRISPVVQWLKTHLPMQGAQVQSLLQEVSTCHGSTKPMCHNY